IFREDDVVRKALVGVEIELEIEVLVVSHALAEEGVDVGAVEGVCNFAGKGGVVLCALLAQVESRQFVRPSFTRKLVDGLVVDLLLLREEVVLSKEVGE